MCFRNIEEMKQQLKELWKEGTHICSVPGPTGEQAKVRGYCCSISVVLMKKGSHNSSKMVKDCLSWLHKQIC